MGIFLTHIHTVKHFVFDGVSNTMKIVFLLYIGALFILPYTAHAAILTKPANNLGLVGYWNFNEGTSTYAGDFSVNNNAGVLTNMANPPTAVSGWGNGKFGGGLNFDGTDDYVSVPDQNYFSPSVNDVTVSFWAKIETNATPDDNNGCGAAGDYLIAKGTTSQWEWGFENDGNDRFCMTLWQSGGSNHMSIGVLRTMNDGRWHHYVGVMDYLTEYRIYVDGISVGTTGTYSGTVDNGTQPVEIGRRGTGDNAQAIIDDVRVFSRALTASQISALYQNGSARFASSQTLTQGTTLANGLVGHWTFDGKDTTNTTVTDLSGQGNTGTFTNFTRATNATAGKLGQGMNFDGTNDYVNVPGVPLPTGDFTYSLWTNLDSNTDEILAMASDGTGGNEFFIWVSSTNKLVVAVDNVTLSDSTASVPTGTWTYITVVRSGSSVTYYLNGVADSSRSGAGTLNFGSCQLLLGADNDTSGCVASLGNWLDGRLDDVRIYNRALSANEVKQLYNLGSAKAQASSVTLQQGTTLASGLVGLWTFDGNKTTTTTALDSSGQNNTGTFTNFTRATNAKAGKLGQGMSFDGTDDYVNAGDIATIDTATALSVCAWVKHNSLTDDDAIVIKSNATSSDGINFFRDDVGFVSGRTDTYTIYFADSADTDDARIEGVSGSSVTNTWTFVCGTFQALSATGLRLYKNGAEDANSPASTALVGAINAGTNVLGIGALPADVSRTFNGQIDDVRIYNRALSASEVKQLYLMGK